MSVPWEANALPSSTTHSLPKSHFSGGKSFLGSSWDPVRRLEAEAWGSHRTENNNVPGETAASGSKGQPSLVWDVWEGRTQLIHAHIQTPGHLTTPCHLSWVPQRTLRESQPTLRALQAVNGISAVYHLQEHGTEGPQKKGSPVWAQWDRARDHGHLFKCLSPLGFLPCAPNLIIYKGEKHAEQDGLAQGISISKHWLFQAFKIVGNFGNTPGLRSLPKEGK